MGFEEGRIILDNADGIYIPGQPVFGRLVFEQESPKNIHGIYVSYKGYCKVHWTTTETRRVNDRDETRTIHHESYEEYFHWKNYIFGNASGEYCLKPGHHDYTFSCPIPANCPSSFEGKYGHIRYRVKVVMVTSGIFSLNKDKKVALRIHAPLDLNQRPSCRGPLEFELDKTYCCWCLRAGFSEIRVKLPVGGYCPGQIIPMEVSVVNQSSVEIKELKFSIKEVIKFVATMKPGTRFDSNTVATIKKGPIPGHTTRNWQVDMEVPAMSVYNLNTCQFIGVEHYFKVSTEVSGCHRGSEASHVIVIGTVPFGVPQHVPVHSQNVPGVNYYPPAPIMNQPLPHPTYPTGPSYPSDPSYPAVSPYPSAPSHPIESPYPPSRPHSDAKHNEFHNPAAFMPPPTSPGTNPFTTATAPESSTTFSGKSPSPPPPYSPEPEDRDKKSYT